MRDNQIKTKVIKILRKWREIEKEIQECKECYLVSLPKTVCPFHLRQMDRLKEERDKIIILDI